MNREKLFTAANISDYHRIKLLTTETTLNCPKITTVLSKRRTKAQVTQGKTILF